MSQFPRIVIVNMSISDRATRNTLYLNRSSLRPVSILCKIIKRLNPMNAIREARNKPQSTKAKHCSLNGIAFDSLSERDFYVRLCRLFGSENISRGPRLVLVESEDPNTPDVAWTVDFKVYTPKGLVYVEYKGSLSNKQPGTEVFLMKWKLIKGNAWLKQVPIVCFVAGSKTPVWTTKNGRVSIPCIYPISMYDDHEIETLILSAI